MRLHLTLAIAVAILLSLPTLAQQPAMSGAAATLTDVDLSHGKAMLTVLNTRDITTAIRRHLGKAC
jgi:hypothetical protein